MVNVKPTVVMRGQTERTKRESLKRVQDQQPHVVRVEPAREELRFVLRHPTKNIAFRKTGSVEWPLDSFTRRRIADGSVRVVQEVKGEAKREPRMPPAQHGPQ